MKSYGVKGIHYSHKTRIHYKYRSLLEKSVYEALDSITSIIVYYTEPFTVTYYLHGRLHHYIPDLVIKTNNHMYVCEVKPSSKLNDQKNIAKFNAIVEKCKYMGYTFIIITEKDIHRLKYMIL